MFVFIEQKADFTLGHKHHTFISLTSNNKLLTSHERIKLHVANVLTFLNSYNKGAHWWFWWAETCSTVLYNIKVLCLHTSFVFQVRLNEGLLDCRWRLCFIRLVSGIHSFSKNVGAPSMVTWNNYLTEALQLCICPSDLVPGFVHLHLLWLLYCLCWGVVCCKHSNFHVFMTSALLPG